MPVAPCIELDQTGVEPILRAESRHARVMFAVAILTAVASAALLLWLAAGDGTGGYRGIERSCISRFEDGGGDTSICDRVPVGAGANVLGHLSLALLSGVLLLRRRARVVWARAAVTASLVLTVLCYVVMRSCEFGLGQRLL